jgi:hypothetical protein
MVAFPRSEGRASPRASVKTESCDRNVKLDQAMGAVRPRADEHNAARLALK